MAALPTPASSGFRLLTAFGLSAPWQAALLLPRDFDDFAGAHESLASVPTGQRALLRACLVCPPSFQSGSPVPRLRLTLRDDEHLFLDR